MPPKVDLILSRPALDETGKPLVLDGAKVVEVLLVKWPFSDLYVIPTLGRLEEEGVEKARERLLETILRNARDANYAGQLWSQLRSSSAQAFREVFRGVVSDPRNTDNAWRESIIFNVHIENSPGSTGLAGLGAKWIPLNGGEHLKEVWCHHVLIRR